MPEYSRTFETASASQTRELGLQLGLAFEKGCVIALVGDLGAGKTCFVQGLARGLGVPDDVPVTSPSYTLVNEYPARLLLQHADLYRLSGDVDLEDIGLFELADSESVVIVEWADRSDFEDLKPDLFIHITPLGETRRRIFIHPTGQQMVNLLKGFQFSI
ncbi:MAG: tRNA (adenosine(37)-N6)-threonylcarbamoyltransferase complex ATPase subunit type 1 TsaE [Desulfatibacillum sp.]|nr:tRNA (adenosine(37)-N6)-threonylcarbamoyltransferase complex ATPase subunit type 1 TsaE [Desulfatibacillum sp.]